MAKPEAVAERRFRNWCIERGHWCLKCSLPGFTGMPDRMVLGKNRLIVFVEFKQEGKRPTRRQEYVHGVLKQFGFPVITTTTAELAKEAVQNWEVFCSAAAEAELHSP